MAALPGDDDLLSPHDDALLLGQLGEDVGVAGQPVPSPARLDVLHHLLSSLSFWVASCIIFLVTAVGSWSSTTRLTLLLRGAAGPGTVITGVHCCNGSIFLPVPVPVLELIQIIWQFRVRF